MGFRSLRSVKVLTLIVIGSLRSVEVLKVLTLIRWKMWKVFQLLDQGKRHLPLFPIGFTRLDSILAIKYCLICYVKVLKC